MRSLLKTVLSGACLALPGSAAAQSACTDATESGRIVRTGPTRTVAVAAAGVSVCMTAEGFSDSLEIQPRDWPSRARFVVLETVAGSNARRMEISAVVTTLSRNGRPSPIDSDATLWRSQALEVAGLHWDLVTMHARRFDIDIELAATLQLKKVILDEMASIRSRADELNAAFAQQQRKDRDAQEALTKARQNHASLRASVGRAQAAVARAETAEDRSRAQQNLADLQNQLSRASAVLQTAEGKSYAPGTSAIQLQIDALNEKPRMEILKTRLADLDPDARAEWLRASRVEVSEDRAKALEQRLAEAATRLKATLSR